MIRCGHGKPLDQECLACEKLDVIHDRLRSRVSELEAAIKKHKDNYIFTKPDFADYELWKTIEP